MAVEDSSGRGQDEGVLFSTHCLTLAALDTAAKSPESDEWLCMVILLPPFLPGNKWLLY